MAFVLGRRGWVIGGGSSGPPEPVDLHFANVMLLLGFDTDFSDESWMGQSVAPTNVSRVSSVTNFGGTHALETAQSSNNSGLNFLSNFLTDMEFGTDDFTIEMWVFPTVSVSSGNQHLLTNWRPSQTSGFYLDRTSADVLRFGFGPTQIFGTTVISNGAWAHIAVTRQGNIVRIWVDGQIDAEGTFTAAVGAALEDMTLGWDGISGDGRWRGLIDEVRVTRGVCRYTAPFAVPTQPFPRAAPDFAPPARGVRLDPHLIPSSYTIGNRERAVWNSSNNNQRWATSERGIMPHMGRRYWEVQCRQPAGNAQFDGYHGVVSEAQYPDFNTAAENPRLLGSVAWRGIGQLWSSPNTSAVQLGGTYPTYGVGSRLMFVFDASTGGIWIGVDGVWQDDPAGPPTFTTSPGNYWPFLQARSDGDGSTLFSTVDRFKYPVPTGSTPLAEDQDLIFFVANTYVEFGAAVGTLASAVDTYIEVEI